MRNQGKLVTPAAAAAGGVGPAVRDARPNYLRVYLAAIRRKLEPTRRSPRYFITEPGMGYRFTTVHEPEP